MGLSEDKKKLLSKILENSFEENFMDDELLLIVKISEDLELENQGCLREKYEEIINELPF